MAIENADLSELALDYAFVTIEPCVMCDGAVDLPRPTWSMGLQSKKFGAAGSWHIILTDERLNHRVDVEIEFWKMKCAAIMQDF